MYCCRVQADGPMNQFHPAEAPSQGRGKYRLAQAVVQALMGKPVGASVATWPATVSMYPPDLPRAAHLLLRHRKTTVLRVVADAY